MFRRQLGIASFALTTVVAQAQVTQRVNVDSAGAQADLGTGQASVSANGRFVAFRSTATNLVPGDTNSLSDVFVRDVLLGQTVRASVSSSGAQAQGGWDQDGYFWPPAISADGRYVLFMSSATNLFVGDGNHARDVFVRDLHLGTTTVVNVSSTGELALAESDAHSISADGRYVAFTSPAPNLVPGDTWGTYDVFVRDLSLGVTTRVSVDPSGAQANGQSMDPVISADGRWIAFMSTATNLVPGDWNGANDIHVHDRLTGQMSRVSVSSGGVIGNGDSDRPWISADGRYVTFTSYATNLVPGQTGSWTDVFVHDRLRAQTKIASVSSAGLQGNQYSFLGFVSGDGRYVAFQSFASNLVPADTNGTFDIFVHDLASRETTRVNVTPAGGQSVGDGPAYGGFPSCSSDGRWIAFSSYAADLVAGDTNQTSDVFLRDQFGFAPPVLYCSGDGSGTGCPCGNVGGAWRGCEHEFAADGGGLLTSSGTPSVSADSFLLRGSGMPPAANALYFQGTLATNGGLGAAFGDGLRCVGGSTVRLGTETNVGGASSHGAPAGDVPISVRGAIPQAGGTFLYQVWYRNVDPWFCTPSTFNLTNGLSATWIP